MTKKNVGKALLLFGILLLITGILMTIFIGVVLSASVVLFLSILFNSGGIFLLTSR